MWKPTCDFILDPDPVSTGFAIDPCCVCIEEEVDNGIFVSGLMCCQIKIHSKCLLRIILHGFDCCPLCRSPLQIDSILSEEHVAFYYNSFTAHERKKYSVPANELLYRLAQKQPIFGLQCFKLPPPRRVLPMFVIKCLRYVSVIASITLFYILLFLLVDWQHFNHFNPDNFDVMA
jgi:hypothetical protein